MGPVAAGPVAAGPVATVPVQVEPLRTQPFAARTADTGSSTAGSRIGDHGSAPDASRTAASPVPGAPILSEDEWWQWDGATWVPADPAPTVAAPPAATATERVPVRLTEPPAATDAASPGTFAEPERAGAGDWTSWSAPTSAARPWSPAGGPPGYGLPAAYPPPPGYPGPATAHLPQRGRDGLAVAALVCSLIPVFLVAQLLALVFAIITLNRVGRTGQKGQVMAFVAIGISVLMFFISAAIAIPVFLNQRANTSDARVESVLRTTATEENSFRISDGTYVGAADLLASGERVPNGIDVFVLAAGSAGYCLAAGRAGGTRWLAWNGYQDELEPGAYPNAQSAIDSCNGTSTGATSGAV